MWSVGMTCTTPLILLYIKVALLSHSFVEGLQLQSAHKFCGTGIHYSVVAEIMGESPHGATLDGFNLLFGTQI